MTRKYTPPKKKKNHQAAHAHPGRIEGALPQPNDEVSVVYAAVAGDSSDAATATSDARPVTLLMELRRMTSLTVITVVMLIVLWLIFR